MSASANDPCTTEPKSLQRFFLQRLVQFTETLAAGPPAPAIHLPITLLVEGQLLSGNLISYAEYLKGSLRSIEDALRHAVARSGSSPPANLHLLGEEVQKIVSTRPSAPDGYVWLSGICGNWRTPSASSVPEHVAEIAIERVAVFWLGHSA